MTKTICVDARMLYSSGIGTFLRNLLQVMKKNTNFSLQLIADKSLVSKDEFLSGYDLIPATSSIYSVKEQLELPLKIPTCDVFWSPHFNVPFFPIKAKKRVVTIHDVLHLAYPSYFNFHKRVFAKILIERAVQASDLIVTDSHFSKDEIQKYTRAKKEKIRVVHLGIDTSEFTSESDESVLKKIKEKYRLPEKFILFVSNIKPHKNVSALIEAYKHWLKVKGPEYHLVILGKSFAEYSLPQERNLQGQVHFFHDVKNHEIPFFYQLASVSVLPSFYEGFGLTPLESMASGCPAIVSHAASLPEVCGAAVIYIDPRAPIQIFEALEKCLENPLLRDVLQRKGREQVQLFQWKNTAARYVQIFEELTSR